MKEVTIKQVEEKFDLVVKYQSQINPQDVVIDLDLESGELSARYNPEIGNSVLEAVWNGRIREWGLNRFTYPAAEAMNDYLEDIKPLAEIILNDSAVKWDSSNHVGVMGQEAREAEDRIINSLMNADFTELIEITDSYSWLDGIKADIQPTLKDKSDDELQAMAENYEEEANSENYYITDSVFNTLKEWQSED
jgi:hypothetical protein